MAKRYHFFYVLNQVVMGLFFGNRVCALKIVKHICILNGTQASFVLIVRFYYFFQLIFDIFKLVGTHFMLLRKTFSQPASIFQLIMM